MKTPIMVLLLISLTFACSDNMIKKEEGFLMLNDYKIHYKVAGSGEPIVFVHGGYMNLDMWNEQLDFFAQKGYQAISFSDLGHGETKGKGEAPYGYEIIAKLAEKFNHEKINLAGLSWGGMLSVDYAINYPEKIDRLILVASGLNGWDYFQDTIAENNYKKRHEAMKNDDIAKTVGLFHQNWIIGPRRSNADIDRAFSQKAYQMIEHTLNNHWKVPWSKLDSIKAIERLDQVKCKTLILLGDQDVKDLEMIADKYQTGIPNNRFVKIKDVAHSINLEAPEVFNKTVLEFLEE